MIFNDIYISGSSGGLATYLNCDRVAAMLSPSTRFACLADAGYFLDHTARDGSPTTSPQFKESFYAWNSSAGTNQVRPGASTGGGGGARGGSSLSGFSSPTHSPFSHTHCLCLGSFSISLFCTACRRASPTTLHLARRSSASLRSTSYPSSPRAFSSCRTSTTAGSSRTSLK